MTWISLPNTSLAREALIELRSGAPESLVNHSVRCYLLGREFAARRRLAFDEEGLFLAAAFHDLGLADGHRDRRGPFTAVGARTVREFLERHGEDPERADRLARAIAWHFQPLPTWKHGPEAGLLQVGAWMDVTGWRRRQIGTAAREVEQAYPRGDFFWKFPACLVRSFGSIASVWGLTVPPRM
ncbi:MAG: HD domain-containing protein [Deltaproteobacteria bacterium]|nr:HD domain-containing protein [Deltaproteobacteria bacterium]